MKHTKLLTVLLAALLVLAILPVAAQEEMPLAERGSYHVGGRNLTFVDETRDGREIKVWLWYPAVVPEDQQDKMAQLEQMRFPLKDLVPDMSGAPYPVVVYSSSYNGYSGEFNMILEPLVSRGFVVAGILHTNPHSAVSHVIDRPLDVLYIIDKLAALNEDTDGEFAGLMNVDQTGVVGFEAGAYAALAVSGARVDTEAVSHYADWFGAAVWYPDWDWAVMKTYHDQLVPSDADARFWSAMTDPRIKAVVAYMPCEVNLLGERGLAAASVPTLLIPGTWDRYCPYNHDAIAAYLNLGSAEHDLLTLVGAVQTQPAPDSESGAVVQQFITAFLGYHLQDKAEYAQYLTAGYAQSFANVVWGIDEITINDPIMQGFGRDVTFIDGGKIDVGDSIVGEIAEVGNRVEYSLILDTDTSLNLYAHAAGTATSDESGASFDPFVYIRDAEGGILSWNNEMTHSDDALGNLDAALEGIALPAGSYTVIVGGFSMRGSESLKRPTQGESNTVIVGDVNGMTGPYELVIESME